MRTYPRRGRRISRYFCLFLLFSLCSPLLATPYFRGSGLMGIPTGAVNQHGSFDIGTNFAFRNRGGLPREEAAMWLDFCLFDRVEVGLTTVRLNQESFLMANLKALLFRETGIAPNMAVGVQNIGDEVKQELIDSWRYKRKSAFIAISKTFNLPRVHQISGHIGIGNNRFSEDRGIGKTLNGIFLGVSKSLQPSFAKGELRISLETDGRGRERGSTPLGEQWLGGISRCGGFGCTSYGRERDSLCRWRLLVKSSDYETRRGDKATSETSGQLATEARNALKKAQVETEKK